MTAMIKSVITNAAEISVLPLIDETYKTGGGPVSVGGMVVVAGKGWPFESQRVYADTWDSVFGDVLSPNKTGYEGLRHLRDCIEDVNWCNVVRVVDATAKFPEITIKEITDKGAWASGDTYNLHDVVTLADDTTRLICINDDVSDTVEPTAASDDWEAFSTPVINNALAYQTNKAGTEPGEGFCLTIWPVDGDPGADRTVKIASALSYLTAWANNTEYDKGDVLPVTGGYLYCITDHTSPETGDAPTLDSPGAYWRELEPKDKRITIEFWNKTSMGVDYEEDSVTVGILETDKDDMGASAFIESVLEYKTDFRCILNDEVTWDSIQDTLAALPESIALTGGTNGSDPSDADYIKAWDIFRNDGEVRHMAAAGCYRSAVLANCFVIAAGLHVTFAYDLPPYLPPDEALAEFKSWGISSRQASALYCPFSRYDPAFEKQVIWGASGSQLAAWAKGEANYTGPTPGVHYSPAGEDRGGLWGTKFKPLYPEEVINLDVFYAARVNPVLPSSDGGVHISDSLSTHFEENYSRFVWVNNIGNYIDHRFVQLAKQVQHEPDGVTYKRLDEGMREIMEALVLSKALVPPSDRDPEADSQPYVYEITQPEIDLWLVTYGYCPTGSARRIAGQPWLIK